jgi:hypothetical protein
MRPRLEMSGKVECGMERWFAIVVVQGRAGDAKLTIAQGGCEASQISLPIRSLQ